MSNQRKLQTEIDRVMKKVDEGVDLFDEIWEKVYAAEQQNQKEKYEMDLKKEIKKLQRLRDQIKTWIGSSDVKDKDPLIQARKLIEKKMEQFKICEKETKTKTYSKEGLARQEKLDPAEEAKLKCTKWIAEYIEKFNELVENLEVEIERLSSGKGKKTNKLQIEEYNDFIAKHKFHINKLEGIMRLVNNDRLEVEEVDALKEDLDYYLEAYEDDDYIQSYDEDYFYEALGLDELDVVNVDRVTNIQAGGKGNATSADETSVASSKTGGKEKASKKKSSSTVIPLTIGRARASSSGEKEKAAPTTPIKLGRATSVPIAQANNNSSGQLGPTPKPAPPPVQTGGASMASILKREGEQEKERQQKALQQQQLLREQQARAQQEQLRQQQLLRQQQEQQQLRQQEALRQQQQQQQQQQQAAQHKAAAQQEALKRQQLQMQEQQQRAQQEAAAKQQQLQAQQQAAEQKKLAQLAAQQQGGSGGIDILNSGLQGLSLGNVENRLTENGPSPMPSLAAVSPKQQTSTSSLDTSAYLTALNDSFASMPSSGESERQKSYTPRNPFPTPSAYPSTPSPIFENPAVFEKLGTDCLFFIFYYSQGTYQQYLAARELKKQSWRYHKKYMTWFQRHEEPKVTTDEYEEGTYVYFDYETGWCQRIKADFRFEYRYLEDSLA